MERGGGLQCLQTLQLANSLCSFVYISLISEFLQVNLFLLISNNAWVCISTHINGSIELYITSSFEFIPHLVHQILQGKETCSLIDHEQFSSKLKNRHKRLCWNISSLFFKKNWILSLEDWTAIKSHGITRKIWKAYRKAKMPIN